MQLKWLSLEFNYLSKIEGLSTLSNLEIVLLGIHLLMQVLTRSLLLRVLTIVPPSKKFT